MFPQENMTLDEFKELVKVHSLLAKYLILNYIGDS